MTRQVGPAWTEPAPECEAGADAVAISATSAARPAIAAIPARRRLKRTSRPIVQFLSCPEAGDAERRCVVPATFPAFVTTPSPEKSRLDCKLFRLLFRELPEH